MAHTRGWAANSLNSRIRLKADLDRAHQGIALLREELRIHQTRMAQLSPHRLLEKMKIAQVLAWAYLHLGVATVGRMLKEGARPMPPTSDRDITKKTRMITAKYPGHLWHTDLTVVPTARGFWTAWLPSTLPQCWPFAWWFALAEDYFSRRVMGYAVFLKEPSSTAVRTMLGQAVAAAGKAPRHIVCDHGPQFDCDAFKCWCSRKGIKPPRYGEIGEHGRLAVIARLSLTLKTLLRHMPVVPLLASDFRRAVGLVLDWCNEHRRHMTLGGKTPSEVYAGSSPANREPRYEPRERWPRSSVCAEPVTLVKGQPGARIGIHVDFASSRRHLPIVQLKRMA